MEIPLTITRPVGAAKLTRDLLTHEATAQSAVITLGLIASAQLKEFGQVGFFINPAGIVEIAPLAELALDTLGVEEAMGLLLKREYTDELILGYLRGRRARALSITEPFSPPASEPSQPSPLLPPSEPSEKPPQETSLPVELEDHEERPLAEDPSSLAPTHPLPLSLPFPSW